MTFKEASEKFLLLKKAETSKSNIGYYNDKFPIINRYIGSNDVTSIDKFTIAEFTLQQLERNPSISNTTLNYYRDIIKRVLKDVCDISLDINSLKEQKKVVPDLPDHIVNQVLNYILEYSKKNKNYKNYFKYYFMLRLLLDTGVRVNELVNIKLKNIDLGMRAIKLQVTKNNKERYVFITEEVRDIYMIYVSKYNIQGEYLFPGEQEHTGSHISKRAIGKFLHKIQTRLGLDRSISPHKWRHTMATRFLARGGTIVVLNHLLGHEDIQTTMIYEHLNRDQLHKMFNNVMKNEV